MTKRGWPGGSSVTCNRLRSTSDETAASGSGTPPAAEQTATAASSGAPPTKTPSLPEDGLLLGGEEVVRPGDGGAHRPLPLRQIAAAAGQERQAPVEPRQERCRWQQIRAGGRQLDGQRQPVEPPADLRHDRRIGLRQRERWGDGLGALDKQPHRRRVAMVERGTGVPSRAAPAAEP